MYAIIERVIARLTLVLALLLLLPAVPRTVSARQWPQFRGPDGQGHSDQRGLPVEWSESRNIAWKTRVPGSGWSSPVVGAGRVWLTTAVADPEGQRSRGISLRLLAFDAATGQEILNVEVFRVARPGNINTKNSYASPTPILDGDTTYVHFGAEGTAALNARGDVLWKTRLAYQSQHGGGGSPALFRDLLIVNCDGNGGVDDDFVVALDTRTGRIRWKTSRRAPADQAYTTPLVINANGRDQVVSVGANQAVAYDPQSGRELWRVAFDGFSNVPRPVYGGGLVYVATGFQQPALLAIRPDGSGDVTRTHVAWTLRRGVPYTPSPILVDATLFLVNDAGIASAVDATTGAIAWQQRLGGNFSASPVYADGRIYFLSEEGRATVVAPGKSYRALAINQLDGAILASMAVADGAFFVRTDTHLYRIGTRR